MRSVFLSTLLVVAGGLVLTDAEVFSCRANFQSGDILKVENNKQYVGSTLYAKDIMCMDMASLGMRCYSLASDTMQIDPAKMVTLSSSGSVGGRGTSDWFFDSNLITDDSVTVSAVMLASPKSVIYNQWTFPRNDWTQKVKTADVSSTLQLTLPYSWSIMSVKTTGQFVYILLNPTCDFSYCPQKPAPYVMMVSVSNFSPSDKVVPIAEGMYEKYEMTEFADSAYKTIASEMTVSKDGQWLASAAGANAFLWTIDQTSGALTNMRKITGERRGAPISLLEFIGDKPVALLQAVERNGVGSVIGLGVNGSSFKGTTPLAYGNSNSAATNGLVSNADGTVFGLAIGGQVFFYNLDLGDFSITPTEQKVYSYAYGTPTFPLIFRDGMFVFQYLITDSFNPTKFLLQRVLITQWTYNAADLASVSRDKAFHIQVRSDTPDFNTMGDGTTGDSISLVACYNSQCCDNARGDKSAIQLSFAKLEPANEAHTLSASTPDILLGDTNYRYSKWGICYLQGGVKGSVCGLMEIGQFSIPKVRDQDCEGSWSEWQCDAAVQCYDANPDPNSIYYKLHNSSTLSAPQPVRWVCASNVVEKSEGCIGRNGETRTYTVLKPQLGEGKACPNPLQEARDCSSSSNKGSLPSCPPDVACSWSFSDYMCDCDKQVNQTVSKKYWPTIRFPIWKGEASGLGKTCQSVKDDLAKPNGPYRTQGKNCIVGTDEVLPCVPKVATCSTPEKIFCTWSAEKNTISSADFTCANTQQCVYSDCCEPCPEIILKEAADGGCTILSSTPTPTDSTPTPRDSQELNPDKNESSSHSVLPAILGGVGGVLVVGGLVLFFFCRRQKQAAQPQTEAFIKMDAKYVSV